MIYITCNLCCGHPVPYAGGIAVLGSGLKLAQSSPALAQYLGMVKWRPTISTVFFLINTAIHHRVTTFVAV